MSTSPPLVVADRYRLVAPLGQGGMGRVWRATDVVLHRDVAIKELVPPPGLTPEERQEMRERSLREARAIARLNNVNVVRVFDVLRTDADPWIVMEYVPSRSLQDALASDGPYPPLRAAEIGLGVLNALRAAHRNGVVHRDVKPGNVLIGEDGRVVLTDFGLATVPGDPNVTRTGLVLGSPAYISPERARDGTAGPGSDLWSLGATLYAAVEGTSPFARPSAIATLAALATENPPPARNAGPLKPVLNGLLRKDPAHRINAEEAERLLLRATGRRSKLSFPMSPTMRRPGVGRERPALPSTPPVVPGSPIKSGPPPAASGSAPVVPGPRPPVTPGRPQETDRPNPVFAPGKASVGRPPTDTPTRIDPPKTDAKPLDATRLDTPPVRDRGRPTSRSNTIPGTGTASPEPSETAAGSTPTTPQSPQGALARGTRGTFGTISAAEIAAHRNRPGTPAPPADPPASTATEASTATDSATSSDTDSATAGSTDKATGSATSTDTDSTTAGSTDTVIGSPAVPAQRTADAEPQNAQATEAKLKVASSPQPEPKHSPPTEPQSSEPDLQAAQPQPDLQDSQPQPDLQDSQPERPDVQHPTPQEATEPPEALNPTQPGGPDLAAQSHPTTAKAAEALTAEALTAGAPIADAAQAGPAADTAEPTDKPAESTTEPRTAKQPIPAPRTGSKSRKKTRGRQPTATQARTKAADGQSNAPDAKPADLTTISAAQTAGPSKATNEDAAAINKAAATDERDAEGAKSEDETRSAQASSLPAIAVATEPATAAATEPATAAATEPATAAATEPATAAATEPATAAANEPATATEAADETETATEPATNAGAAVDEPEPATTAAAQSATKTTTAAAQSATKTEPAPTELAGKANSETDKNPAPQQPSKSSARKVTPTAGSTRSPETLAGTAILDPPVTREAPAPGTPTKAPTAQPARPPWQPMAIPAREPEPRGLTVLGTTLTRRQTVIAAAAILAVLLLLVLLVPRAFGDDDKAGKTPTAPPPASAAATKPATSAPAAPPAATTKPSPAPSKAPAAPDVPKGWYRYTDPTGFSVPLPNGWKADRRGSEVYFEGGGRLLIIDQTKSPKPDPVADWKNQERERRGTTYRNYQKIRLESVDYFQKAADWEFLYTTRAGNAQHAQKRGFIVGPKQAYGISWYTSPDDWNGAKSALDIIYKGFKPAKS